MTSIQTAHRPISVPYTEALFRSNLRNTVEKSMRVGATKKELANVMPGGCSQMQTVSSGVEKADTLGKGM